jgi:hypothetical protein
MTENYEEITDAALTLAPGARAILAERLLQSIPPYWENNQRTDEQVNGSMVSPSQASKPTASVLRLDLTPELEFGLKREAGCRGISPEQFAIEALEESVARSLRERAEKISELFRQWNEEEVDESEALDDEFFKMLDADRSSFRKLFPPELKGISW